MLQITIPAREFYNEQTEEFIETKAVTITLEHSLLSVAKWEQKYKESFFKANFTTKQFLDYVKCMTLTQNVDKNVYSGLTMENYREIQDYMSDVASATTIKEAPGRPKPKRKDLQQTVTSELIYGWMVELGIPFECQKWHLNRLIMLIRVVQELENPQKMNKRDALKSQAALNKARKAKHHTRG